MSYLSKTICEKFIIVMGDVLLEHIKREIKEAKYWGLIIDSTPDVSHADQLSVIFWYHLNDHVYVYIHMYICKVFWFPSYPQSHRQIFERRIIKFI